MIHPCLSLPVPIARDSSATQPQISLQALFLNAARVPADLGTSSRLHPGFLQKQPATTSSRAGAQITSLFAPGILSRHV